MGTLGFSYIGLIFLLMLFVPNIIWTKRKPEGYTAEAEGKKLRTLEGIGQAGVTGTVLIFSDFNIREWSAWSLWLVAAFSLLILYEIWWIRYFKSAMTQEDFYSSLLGVPVAGATLPVAAFFLLSIYGRVVWLSLFVFLLGIGHIGIHLQHKSAIRKEYGIKK